MSDASTRRIVAAMLTENTGRHMLDSGGAYGRHWEQNQGRVFAAEPAAVVRFHVYESGLSIEYTKNLYHYLVERLDYDAAMTATMRRWVHRHEDGSNYWHGKPALRNIDVQLGDMEAWVASMDAGGPFGEPETFNTYNGEDALSQTLQGIVFDLDDTAYVALQVHGGCDVRGGYTSARVFRIDSESFPFDNAEGVITCGEHAWYTTDAGYHWENENGVDLGSYELIVDEDTHEARCPICGAKLVAQ